MINTKNAVEQPTTKYDWLWWLVIFALVVGGIGAYYYYHDVNWALRAAVGLLLACVTIIVILQTAAGRNVWKFAKEARIELYKVVWPTRQETIQTTMVVVGMVILMALILWGIDSILMWLISWFTR